MVYLTAVLHAFWHLLEMTAGVFLLGLGVGLVVYLFLKPTWVERWLSRGHRSALWASLAGAVLPGCALSSVPIAQSLKARGASRGTLTAFLMVAPLLSPHTVALTVVMLGWPFAIWRVVLPITFTWAVGTWLDRTDLRVESGSETIGEGSCCKSGASCGHDGSRTVGAYVIGSAAPLVPYYLGGLFVVALLEPVLKTEWMAQQGSGVFAYFAALVVGIPLYVCDGGEVPLTAALLKLGVGPGPAFTFLLGSVGTCFATMAMAPQIIGWRATVIYVTGTILLALGGGMAFSVLPGVQ